MQAQPTNSVVPAPPVAAHPSFPPLPRAYAGLPSRDIWAAVAGVALLVMAIWVRHGGIGRDPLLALGEVTALGGTYASLVGVLFASRAPWLDQVMGADRLRVAHRWLGFLAVWAIGAHALTSTLAVAGGAIDALPNTLIALVETVPGMLGAVVGMGLLVTVAITSVRAARRRLSYETWHGVHLYAYLAVAFGYLHQLTIGEDFATDPVATWVWIALYLVAFGALLLHRVAWPLALTLRHRPRVERVVEESADVFTLVVTGRNLDRLAVRAGQFFVVRALTRRDLLHGHPFSISAPPDGRTIRFTIRMYGEGTRALRALRPGTPILLEGPYGNMTGARRTGRRLLFVAGGIGIAPIRALVHAFAYEPGTADLIYRVRGEDDLILKRELDEIAEHRGLRIHYLVGHRGTREIGADPLGPAGLTALVPDAAERDAFLCGPDELMTRTRASLLALGGDPARIHLELFG